MKKSFLLFLCGLIAVCSANAQSKVFKEVGEEISTQMKVIVQDNSLVGYLVFTELEKTSEDSFNYRINIMDENLNDIGTVNFKEQKLFLGGVSFDQDVLCIAYLKSNIIGKFYPKKKDYRDAVDLAKNSVFTQFLSLEGKILKTNTIPVDISISPDNYSNSKITAVGSLKNGIQLVNIPEKGFACFFGDHDGNKLVAYTTAGAEQWKKNIDDAQATSLLASKADVYLLLKQKDDDNPLGGWRLQGYGFTDSVMYDKFTLQDQLGNSLTVSGFGNDPVTGNPYLTGSIINEKRRKDFGRAKDYFHGLYSGVYTFNINGHKKNEISQVYSYWSDGSQSDLLTVKGKFVEDNRYGLYYQGLRDYQGNTYFVGTKLFKKPKIGSIFWSIVLLPTIYGAAAVAAGGYTKTKASDAIIVKQNPKGGLSLENTISSNENGAYNSKIPLSDDKSFYSISNSATKTNYVIVDDPKNINIYNITQKKIVRTIPHKDGKLRINIYPAKEGSIMVSEYNKKEKYTKFSIEAL